MLRTKKGTGIVAMVVALFLTGLCSTRTLAAGLLIADGGFGGVLEMVDHEVKVTINNRIAVTEVHQSFKNMENRQVEALYTFPVPKGATVANFSMWINGKEMIGEVVEKKRAREIYNSYKETRRDPGLLEQKDYKTFEMRIFPINAGATQKVKITYYQELDLDGDWGTYVYPLNTATKPGIDQSITGKFALSMDIRNAVSIVELKSTSHSKDFVIANHTPNYWQASLETAGGSLDRDFVLAFHQSRLKTGVDIITSKTKREDGYFMLTLTAGEELKKFDQPQDYLFVLDISGSMAADGKLLTSVKSIAAFIDALGNRDRFEVIAFNVQPRTLFGSLQTSDDTARQKARKFLDSQEARGGTVLKPALSTAYKYAKDNADRPLNIIILSDGMTEQSERAELLRLLAERPTGSRVFCIGVGNEVNKPLLEQVAKDAGGIAAFISRGDDFDRQAKAFRRKLMRPAVREVKISFEGSKGDDIYDVEPQTLGNLYHGTPVTLYGRYKKAGPVKVNIAGTVNGRAITMGGQFDLPKADDENPQIERMWALKRVDQLLKKADRQGSRSSVTEQIVGLGEAYSIVTEYTSFIVLENDAEYKRWAIDRRNALRILRDRNARDQLQKQLASMREKALTDLGLTSESESLALAVNTNTPARQPVAKPQSQAPTQTQAPARVPTTNNRNRRGFDLDFGGGGGGGGAIDPLAFLFVAMLVGCFGVVIFEKYRKRASK